MDVNDLTDAQLSALADLRQNVPEVKVWPAEDFGVVLVRSNSAGRIRLTRLALDALDGTFSGDKGGGGIYA